MTVRTKVIIVGGGPVGVGLALDLALRGIPSILFEKRATLHSMPRGQNLTQRSMELFDRWGCLEEVRSERLLPEDVPVSGITAYEDFKNEFWHAFEGREAVGQYYWQKNDRIPQYLLERVLRRRVEDFECIKTYIGWEVNQIRQSEHGVEISASDLSNDASLIFEADYLVGCDGGHSFVRENSGLRLDGSEMDRLMALCVFRSKELNFRFNERFPYMSTYRVLHPDLKGYWQFFGRVDRDESWFFHAPLPIGSSRDTPTDFKAMIYKACGFEFALEFDSTGLWDMRVAVATKYRNNRIFIAGDAAHSHPPYGGFGLNNGLEDVANLSWKLAARLQNWGSDELLDSYDQERRLVMKDVAERFISARMSWEGELIARHDPDAERDAFTHAWASLKSDSHKFIRNYEPNYEGSPIVSGSSGGVTQAHGEYSFKARPGHHLAPCRLETGRNIYSILERGFNLGAFSARPDDVAAFRHSSERLGIPLNVIADHTSACEHYGARLVLIRPDQYVAWAGDTLDEPGDLLARSCGL